MCAQGVRKRMVPQFAVAFPVTTAGRATIDVWAAGGKGAGLIWQGGDALHKQHARRTAPQVCKVDTQAAWLP